MDNKLREIDIQPDDRVVYIHIPKTAGTTFKIILQSLLWGFNYYPDWKFINLGNDELEKIRQYQLFIGHFTHSLFSETIFPDGFIGLTFLRDPVKRTISHLRFMHQEFQQGTLYNYYPQKKGNVIKETSLRELAKALLMAEGYKDIDLLMEFLINNNYKLAANFVDYQVKIMGTKKRDLKTKVVKQETPTITFENLDLAQKRLEDLAFFGLTDRYQDSLFLLSYIFGWRPILNTLHLNESQKPERVAGPSATVKAMIEENLTLDIPFYKFGEQLFQQRFHDMTEALLKCYGKREHATLKWPVPNDLIVKLLEQHYIKRRDQRLRHLSPHSRFLAYRPSMYTESPFGWYPLENSDIHGDYRWSGPGLQSGFDLPCPTGKDIRISFCLLAAMEFGIIEGLSLTINGIPIEIQFTTDPEGRFVFSGDVPRQAISGPFFRLIFSVPKTVTPHSLDQNNVDCRSLGIALNWINLQSLSDFSTHEFSTPNRKPQTT